MWSWGRWVPFESFYFAKTSTVGEDRARGIKQSCFWLVESSSDWATKVGLSLLNQSNIYSLTIVIAIKVFKFCKVFMTMCQNYLEGLTPFICSAWENALNCRRNTLIPSPFGNSVIVDKRNLANVQIFLQVTQDKIEFLHLESQLQRDEL